FSNAYSHVSVQVSGVSKVKQEDDGGQPVPADVPASLVQRITTIPGVAGATGIVRADGAHVIGADGKVLTTTGAPRFGINWTGTSTLESINAGRAPQADNEVVVDAGVLADGNLHIGQPVGVSVYGVKHMFTLVGTFVYSGGRDSLGGEQTVAFTTPVAQQLMLGQAGQFNAIDVTPQSGVSDNALRSDVAKALGHGYNVQTGAQLAKQSTQSLDNSLGFVKDIFLGFAGIALFVGIFLILNTFSIIVAQRTRELALLRALGGSRRQMIGSVLLEALVIGVLASTIGLAAGVGVGVLLAYVFGHVGGGSLHLTGVGLPASAVIASYAVGVTITLIAALLPALRAARVAPVAAMRDAATPDRSLAKLTVTGAIILAAGGALLGTGLAGAGGSTLLLIVVGTLIAFVGVAVLTPAISRPVVGALGSVLSWSIPGKLGKRNSARNPRRTAITAAALMVGIALISGVTIVLQSTKTSATSIAHQTVNADLVISSSDGGETFDKSVLSQAATTPGVREVLGLYQDPAIVNGSKTYVAAIDAAHPLTDIYTLKTVSGSIGAVGPNQILVDAPTAAKDGLHIGSPVKVQLTKGAPVTLTLSGTYAKNLLTSGWVINSSLASQFSVDQPYQAYIKVDQGASVGAV
ncbi:MAG TPA: ABC transporter permease, partial [Micromonosporaceae bacterium]